MCLEKLEAVVTSLAGQHRLLNNKLQRLVVVKGDEPGSTLRQCCYLTEHLDNFVISLSIQII